MDFKLLVICFLSLVSVNTEKISYEGYKLFKVVPKTEEHVKILQDISKDRLGTFWEDHFGVNDNVKVMVADKNVKEFVNITKIANIEANVTIDNIQRAIDDQLKSAPSRDSTSFHSLTWDRYHTLEEIYAWLDELVAAYPDVVTPVVMGTSYEGRQIRGLVINFNTYTSVLYPYAGMIESTIHAREWITPAAVTWVIKEFLTSTDPEIRELAENFEWHIFPVVNTDGYAYTFSTNRMWRKNRNTAHFTSCNGTQVDDDMSNGVDLNRNFDYHWNTVGTSPDPCSNTYPGPSAFSEPETQALVQYVRNLNQRAYLVYYLAFHSYTQLVVIPYSNINGFEALTATNYANMYEIAIRGADRLKQRYGTEYRVGVSPDIMYPMSGTSFDWVKFETRVPVAFLLELRDLGEFGFILPPDQIIPTSLETMDFLVEMHKQTKAMGYHLLAAKADTLHCFAVVIIGAAFMMILR